MRVTIDNLDGRGAQDCTSWLDASHPLEIVRRWNEPSTCVLTVSGGDSLPQLLRNGRIVVAGDDAALLFTGYILTDPVKELVGTGIEGQVFRVRAAAISDEALLDAAALPQSAGSYGQTVGALLKALTARVGTLDTTGVIGAAAIGHFAIQPGESWSKNAGALASSARSSYRVMDGKLMLAPVGSTVHELSEGAGTLELIGLQTSIVKRLANDVTVCGMTEPEAYVTELFEGDGVTTLFNLSQRPFRITGAKSTLVEDLFQAAAINPQIWNVTDPGSHLAITSAGLTLSGGNGVDGGTVVTGIDTVEIGGSLVLEAGGVLLNTGSDGLLLGLYTGAVQEANCFAGLRVKQAGGSTVIVPLIDGLESGPQFTAGAGNMYTLRLRIHCAEAQRVLETYSSMGDEGLESFGGSLVTAGADIEMEVQPVVNGVPGTPVVLYDGTVSSAPPVCTLAAVNSTNLLGSLRSIRVKDSGCTWVTSTPPGGGSATRRIGKTAEGGQCQVSAAGVLQFYPGNIPVTGESIRVSYRTAGRSVARKTDTASVARERTSAFNGTLHWTGSVTRPAARSSADCGNAALAILNASTSRSAALSGRYKATNPGDVWPGDVLAVGSASSGFTANLVVRKVEIRAAPVAPEALEYTIDFANDWAEELSIRLSSHVPEDVWLPAQGNVPVLANLSGLTATAVTAQKISVSTGAAAPQGGGFEVRRRDWSFGPGTDADLVLRSPAGNFDIPRAAAVEQFYVRMYDGSTPPVYSRFSSAVFVNLPV